MLTELNTDAIALLYAADELTAVERAEIESRAAADPATRVALDRAVEELQQFNRTMQTLDALALARETAIGPVASEWPQGQRATQGEAASVRRVGAAMRQKLAEQAARATPQRVAGRTGSRYRWWVYPAVSAAAVTLMFLNWWGRQHDLLRLPREVNPSQSYVMGPHPSTGESGGTAGSSPAPHAPAADETTLAEDITRRFDDDLSNKADPNESVATQDVIPLAKPSLDAVARQIADLDDSRNEPASSLFSSPDWNRNE